MCLSDPKKSWSFHFKGTRTRRVVNTNERSKGQREASGDATCEVLGT